MSPPSPVEAILLTLRAGSGLQEAHAVRTRVETVLAIDVDEYASKESHELERCLRRRPRLNGLVHVLCNPPRERSESFRICRVPRDGY
jgi:hypothetical protein